MAMDIMMAGRKRKGEPSIDIEIEKKSTDDLKYDDEIEKKEDPLAEFDDEEILMSLQARPSLMEIIKKKVVGEPEMEEEKAEGFPEEEDESAVPPTNILGTM